MRKKEIMEELLDRYDQLKSINNKGTEEIMKCYIRKLELLLIKELEEK